MTVKLIQTASCSGRRALDQKNEPQVQEEQREQEEQKFVTMLGQHHALPLLPIIQDCILPSHLAARRITSGFQLCSHMLMKLSIMT